MPCAISAQMGRGSYWDVAEQLALCSSMTENGNHGFMVKVNSTTAFLDLVRVTVNHPLNLHAKDRRPMQKACLHASSLMPGANQRFQACKKVGSHDHPQIAKSMASLQCYGHGNMFGQACAKRRSQLMSTHGELSQCKAARNKLTTILLGLWHAPALKQLIEPWILFEHYRLMHAIMNELLQ